MDLNHEQMRNNFMHNINDDTAENKVRATIGLLLLEISEKLDNQKCSCNANNVTEITVEEKPPAAEPIQRNYNRKKSPKKEEVSHPPIETDKPRYTSTESGGGILS